MRITEVNQTACNLLEQKPTTLLRKRFNSLVHPNFQDKLHFCRINLEKNIPIQCDVKIKKNTKAYFFARIIGTTVQKPKNSVSYKISLIDISLEKKLENKLKNETEIAQRNEKLKSIFLANMSHEIRTPLNGILGFSELLISNNIETDKMKEFAQIINDSGNRLLNLINNLLEFSKIESGSVKLIKKPFNLLTVIDDVLKLFEANARKKGLVFEKVFNEKQSILTNFNSDRIKITQILNNLINNAVKFSDKGKITVTIETFQNQIIVSIKDSGPGINPEKIKNLFTRYYQDYENPNNASGGTGLGLAICKSLIEMLGGKIGVKSELGVGTVLFFTLPIENV